MKNTLITLTATALLSIGTIAIADELVSVIDPQELQSMGLEPDSPNVYKSVGNAANEEANFGTGVNYTSIDAKAFNGREGDWDYRNGANGINRISANESYADAQLHVPHGAKLTEIRWWGLDTNVTQDMRLQFFTYCLPDAGPANFTITNLVDEGSNTSAGYFTQSYPLDPYG